MKNKTITAMVLFLAGIFIVAFGVVLVVGTPDDSIVGLWHFDEGFGSTAADSSGYNNDGTLTNMAPTTDWVTGKFGEALDFDGQNDHVRVPDSDTYEVSTGTIVIWFKTDTDYTATNRGNGYLIGKQAGDGWSTFSVCMLGAYHHKYDGGKLLFWVRGSDHYQKIWLQSPTRLDDGAWHHVAGVWGSEGGKLYIDGLEVASNLDTGWWGGNTAPLGIGTIMKGSGALPYAFDGVIDEVRIYNRVLSDEEIAASADLTCVTPPDNLVSWWDADTVSETTAFDIQDGNDGTMVGSVSFVPGMVGDAFTFTGTGTDYVRVPNHTSLEPASVTVDAWVRAPISPGGARYIVAKGAQGCTAASYALYTSGGGLRFYVYSGIGSGYELSPYVVPGIIWDGQWHHVAGTYNGTAVRLYVDGAQVGSGTPADISIGYGLATDNDLIIGQYTGTCSLPFKGDIDEVEVFNRALTAPEIQAIFEADIAGKCKNEPPIAVCMDIEVTADENCQSRIITPEDVDGGSYDPDDDPIILSIDSAGPFSLGGGHPVNLTVTDDNGESDTCLAIVTVVDRTPPVPDVAVLPDVTGECSAEIASIPTASDYCEGNIIGMTTDPLSYTQQGTYTVTWIYDDGNGNTTTQTQTVVVDDVTAPEISVSVSPDTLRPPNHKMVPITSTIIASDNCGSDPAVVLTSVEMNEGDGEDTYHPIYDSTLGAGHTTDDIQVDGNGDIYLRAERSGKGDGRIYTITYTATDTSGNSATATATVTVPHDQK